MEDDITTTLIGALLLLAAIGVLCQCALLLAQARRRRRRHQGYRLIHALNAYSAWVECQRELPFSANSLDELTSPPPLTLARQIKRETFPGLAPHLVRLLQAHSRMIEHLWQQNLLRLSQGAAWRPSHEDPDYLELRSRQEELIDAMVGACRALIGDDEMQWRRTASDFTFSSNWSGHGPASRA